MKSFFISLLILFSLELTLNLEPTKAQSLTNLSIFKSFNHSMYGLHSALRFMHSAVTPHITGSGTSTDPFVLYDALDVDSIRYLGMNNKYYELGNSIDLSSITAFVPIPFDNTNSAFSLDGKNFTLSNMRQSNGVYSSTMTAIAVGMFMGKGTGSLIIKDLIIDGFRITYTSTSSASTSYLSAGCLIAQISNSCNAQLTNIVVKNSSIRFTGNPTTHPNSFYTGLLVGRFLSAKFANICYIKNCLAEYDTIYYSTTYTPNSGHHIGGIVGYIGGSYAYQFEYNASRYNYFYSRTGSTIRTNCGGGLIGETSTPASSFRYNYSHSNKADFGNGGSPNNFPWGWGGIFGYTSVNNIHTFQQNYAANNQCLGTNQSAGFYVEDNSTTTAQVIDSTLNFCDMTSFTEPNTVYGSVRLTASQYPLAKTSSQLKDINTFVGWDFTNTWSIDSTKNNGYPYVLSSAY